MSILRGIEMTPHPAVFLGAEGCFGRRTRSRSRSLLVWSSAPGQPAWHEPWCTRQTIQGIAAAIPRFACQAEVGTSDVGRPKSMDFLWGLVLCFHVWHAVVDA